MLCIIMYKLLSHLFVYSRVVVVFVKLAAAREPLQPFRAPGSDSAKCKLIGQ
jgi:hypothetical protein